MEIPNARAGSSLARKSLGRKRPPSPEVPSRADDADGGSIAPTSAGAGRACAGAAAAAGGGEITPGVPGVGAKTGSAAQLSGAAPPRALSAKERRIQQVAAQTLRALWLLRAHD